MRFDILRHRSRIAAALAAAAVVLWTAPAPALGSDSARVPLPTPNFKGKGEQCVEDTEFMRRNHMELILHQRDETMHAGIRTRQHSLKNCINCHASPETNSVLGENGFCVSCHSYASVKMDCFSCHSDEPEPESTADGAAPHLGDPRAGRSLGRKVSLTPAEHADLVDAVAAPSSGTPN